MTRKRILWLCSWYPSKKDPFNGDFIQRQAIAAAALNDIYVLHVTSEAEELPELISPLVSGLTEEIIYLRKANHIAARIMYYAKVLRAYRTAVRRYISNYGPPDIIHVHIPFPVGAAALWIKRKYKIPFIVTEHWTIHQPAHKALLGKPGYLFEKLMKRVLLQAEMLLPVSNDLGQLLLKQSPNKTVRVIDNAVDTDLFFPGTSEEDKPFRFIHVSNMTPQKNTEAVIEGFLRSQQKYPGTELVLVGPIPEKVQKFIGNSITPPGSIIIKGEIPYNEVANQLRSANAFILGSLFENSPCSIIEALACGLPVLAPAIGGIPELINAENGILIEGSDPDAIANGISRMFEVYSSFDKTAISVKAHDRFNYSIIGKKINEAYRQLTF